MQDESTARREFHHLLAFARGKGIDGPFEAQRDVHLPDQKGARAPEMETAYFVKA